jgi:hypothetical protein
MIVSPRRRHARAHGQAHQRVGHHMLGKQRRAIGAHAKEGRMPQRDDAGVAQDQVQRQRKQRQDGDLVDQRRMRGKHKGRGPQQHPGAQLPSAPAHRRAQRLLNAAHRPPSRENKPCGRHSRMPIISR